MDNMITMMIHIDFHILNQTSCDALKVYAWENWDLYESYIQVILRKIVMTTRGFVCIYWSALVTADDLLPCKAAPEGLR